MNRFMKKVGVGTVALGLTVGGLAALGVSGASAQTGFDNQYTITLVSSLVPVIPPATTTTVAPTTTTTAAPTTTTTAAPAVPASAGISSDFAINVDTATISGETDAVNAACSPTDTFSVGQTVLWRMYGKDLLTGKLLLPGAAPGAAATAATPGNVNTVVVSLPGTTAGSVAKVAMAYSTRDGWWTGVLPMTGYAPGNYNYTVTVTTYPVAGVKGHKAAKATKSHKAIKAVKTVKAIPAMSFTFPG
ncbi:MAG: hypothetical protein ABSG24_00300 [Acidimicrobiales bacterium]|jgi:hypothetical protein